SERHACPERGQLGNLPTAKKKRGGFGTMCGKTPGRCEDEVVTLVEIGVSTIRTAVGFLSEAGAGDRGRRGAGGVRIGQVVELAGKRFALIVNTVAPGV